MAAQSSEKTASVKLTLDGSNYLVNVRKMGDESEKQSRRVESGWKRAGVAGLKSVHASVSGMVSSVKSTLGMVAGIGGGVTLAGVVKGAIDARKEFRGIAFDVQAATGQTENWREIMGEAQNAAIKWGVSSEDLGNSFKEVNAETGNFDYAIDAMHAIAVTSRGTGEQVSTLGDVAGALGEKFGVGANDIEDGLATVWSMSRQANIPLDEMDTVIDRIGSSAKLVGIKGVEGFSRVMGIATVAKEATKGMRGALQGTMALIEQMGNPANNKKMALSFGVTTKGKTWDQSIRDIIKKTGGDEKKLAKGFEGEQLKIVVELGRVFKETFEQTSGTVKDRTKAALSAYDRALADSAKANVNAAQIRERAEQNAQSASAQMSSAMERMKKAFTSEEMLDGLTRLSKAAPAAAQHVARLVEFAFESPKTAGAILAGIKLGVPFLSGAMQSAGTDVANTLKAAFPKSIPLIAGAGVIGAAAGAGVALAEVAGDVGEQRRLRRRAMLDAEAEVDRQEKYPDLYTPERKAENLVELGKSIKAARADQGSDTSWADVATLGSTRKWIASTYETGKAEETFNRAQAKIQADLGGAMGDLADSVRKVARDIKSVRIESPAGTSPAAAPATSPARAYRGPQAVPPPMAGYVPIGGH